MLFTLTQALQLVGFTPCLFLVLFLSTLIPRNRQAIIPMLYFAALAGAFALPLLTAYPPLVKTRWLQPGVLLEEGVLTAFSFLLICQFMMGRVPPFPYWLILAIPLIGGVSSLFYVSMLAESDDCLIAASCPELITIRRLYTIFSSSLIFLLLIYYSSRIGGPRGDDINKKHKYWLIIALILLNLMVLAVQLASASGRMGEEDAQFTTVMFRLAFIYLVMTSLFRVFYPAMASSVIELVVAKPPYNPEADLPHAHKVRELLEQQHVYRQMGISRADMAKLAGIGEHHLSRVINRHFGKNFNELLNGYRVEDTKRRLLAETTPITTISFEAGFNSIASFNRVFKDTVGVSPTEFRARQNKVDKAQ